MKKTISFLSTMILITILFALPVFAGENKEADAPQEPVASDNFNPSPASSPAPSQTEMTLPAPTAPTGLIIKNITDTGMDISWHNSPAREEINNYKVYMNGLDIGSTYDTNYSIDNLEADKEYIFYVTAVNDSGEGPASKIAKAVTSLYQPPYNLRAANIGITSIDLQWEGKSDLYHIFLDDGEMLDLVGATSNESFRIENLKPEEEYGVYIVSIYDDNSSDPSKTLNITTGSLKIPSNLRLINIGSTSAVLTWDGDAPYYDLYFDTGDGQYIATTADNKYTITGLEPEGQYEVYLTSVYLDGPSEPSSTLRIMLSKAPVPASVEGIMEASIPYIKTLTPFLIVSFAVGITFLIIENLPSSIGWYRRRY